MTTFPMMAFSLFNDGEFALFGVAIGSALIVLGAAKGIAQLASAAVESQARQPEAGGRIFTTMLIAAALIEGFTFLALVVCLQVGNRVIEALSIVGPAGQP